MARRLEIADALDVLADAMKRMGNATSSVTAALHRLERALGASVPPREFFDMEAPWRGYG